MLDFYTRVLGFTPVYLETFEEAAFTICYLTRSPREQILQDDDERKRVGAEPAGNSPS